jgi:type IV pilus assembly protein PilV
MKRPGKAAGYSLLEVVVAVIILGVGILGLVGLQTATTRQNQNAMAMSIATEHAQSMIDKIRANSGDAEKGYYFLRDVAPGADGTLAAAAGSEAKKDIDRWRASLQKALPNAKVQICRLESADATTCYAGQGDYYQVCIDWKNALTDSNLFEKDTQRVKLVGRL